MTVQNPDGQVAELLAGFEYVNPAPMVALVSPDHGPLAGGTVVNIQGTGFQAGSQVWFGDTLAADVTFLNTRKRLSPKPSPISTKKKNLVAD